MSERRLSFADRKRLRDEAIVDFRHGFINRREFMLRATAAGVSAAFAGKIASAVAAPAPTPRRSRWAKQAEATITIIKGPHHPDDAKFWEPATRRSSCLRRTCTICRRPWCNPRW